MIPARPSGNPSTWSPDRNSIITSQKMMSLYTPVSQGVRRAPFVNGTWFGYGGTRSVSFCHQYRTPPIGGSKWNARGPQVAARPRISIRIVQIISF